MFTLYINIENGHERIHLRLTVTDLSVQLFNFNRIVVITNSGSKMMCTIIPLQYNLYKKYYVQYKFFLSLIN